jgi:predicted nucleotidyltransferase
VARDPPDPRSVVARDPPDPRSVVARDPPDPRRVVARDPPDPRRDAHRSAPDPRRVVDRGPIASRRVVDHPPPDPRIARRNGRRADALLVCAARAQLARDQTSKHPASPIMTTEQATTESVTAQLTRRGLIKPPAIVPDSVHYETEVGSVAYGVSQNKSDLDVYGFCIPPREMLFPHLAGEVFGFGRQHQRFDNYSQHHIKDDERGVVWDLTIYSITRYLQLCMENNPNMVESLFTAPRCVQHASPIAHMLRERRALFLHKGAYHKFKGFAHSQLHKMNTKNPEGRRVAIIEQFGFDVKFAYHAIRLLLEARQILTEHDLDLEAHRAPLLEIRAGEWTQDEVVRRYKELEAELEPLYEASTLRHSPDEDAIKHLLLDCLEQTWGSLAGCVHLPPRVSLL